MAHPSHLAALTECKRSQSDSNLLNPRADRNGVFTMEENAETMDDIDAERKRKHRFLYRLVRPWRWGRPFNKKKGEGEGEFEEGMEGGECEERGSVEGRQERGLHLWTAYRGCARKGNLSQ